MSNEEAAKSSGDSVDQPANSSDASSLSDKEHETCQALRCQLEETAGSVESEAVSNVTDSQGNFYVDLVMGGGAMLGIAVAGLSLPFNRPH